MRNQGVRILPLVGAGLVGVGVGLWLGGAPVAFVSLHTFSRVPDLQPCPLVPLAPPCSPRPTPRYVISIFSRASWGIS